MKRAYNFSPGPAMLPEAVLKKAQGELLNWHDLGMSVMEVSHRGTDYMGLMEQSAADLRELLAIPKNYQILFFSSGATSQFSAVPLNLLHGNLHADYLNTGQWSQKAIAEGKRYGAVNIVTETVKDPLVRVPDPNQWSLDPKAAYVHYTPNETIDGVEFPYVPDTGDVPLVADMSSTILSRPIPVEKFGIIYAGAQKNIGPAGFTIVIIREDLIKECLPNTPVLYDYKVTAENQSCYNTPATFSWYLAGLVFAWLKEQGGLPAMAAINERKAKKLYNFIDGNDFYSNGVAPEFRSWMNVPFSLANEDLNATFLTQANAANLKNLKGHRLVGGMRASIYNAMPEAGVDALIEFMQDFAKRKG